MAPKRKREDTATSSRKQPACAAQSKASATSSASASTSSCFPKTSMQKKALAQKPLAKHGTTMKKIISKKATKPAPKKDKTESDAAPQELAPEPTDAEPVEDGSSPKFTLFNKLPVELRLRIWGFAAPDPCVVHQRQSFHTNVRFRYVRDDGKVPAVLHACQESRYEFLEKYDDPSDVTLAGRRRDHPVYKLYFHDGRTHRNSRPVFFSCDVDTFWGTIYQGNGRDRYRSPYSGISQLDVAKNVKHLVVMRRVIHDWTCMKYLIHKFPSLESLTLLLSGKRMDAGTGWRWVPMNRPPEVNGELNTTAMSAVDEAYVKQIMNDLTSNLEKMKDKLSDARLPVIKFRFEDQFVQNQRITIPPAPRDPIDDLE